VGSTIGGCITGMFLIDHVCVKSAVKPQPTNLPITYVFFACALPLISHDNGTRLTGTTCSVSYLQ